MLSHEKKCLLLIFSSITIPSIRRYFYAHVCQFSSEKKELLQKKCTPDVFVDFRRPNWSTKTVHQYGVSIQSSTNVRETFQQITQKLWATKTRDLDKLFKNQSLITFHFLGFFHWTVSNSFFCCVTVKTICTKVVNIHDWKT